MGIIKLKMYIFLSSVLCVIAGALSPCDSEAGQVCPMSLGKEVGECLTDPSKQVLTDIDGNPRELEPGEQPFELSASCQQFVSINDACAMEIENYCEGNFFHSDTMLCLTTWTKEESLSAECKASLPVHVKEEDEEVDAEKEKWRAERRNARKQAMKDIEKEKKRTEKVKKKSRKSKKEL